MSRLWEFYANQMKMQEEGNSGPDPEMGSVASVGAPASASWHGMFFYNSNKTNIANSKILKNLTK